MKKYLATIENETGQTINIGIESIGDHFKIIYSDANNNELPESSDPIFDSKDDAINYIESSWSDPAFYLDWME